MALSGGPRVEYEWTGPRRGKPVGVLRRQDPTCEMAAIYNSLDSQTVRAYSSSTGPHATKIVYLVAMKGLI